MVDLDGLIVDCIEQLERDGSQALDAFCARHPQHATALRAAVQELLDSGLVATPAPAPALDDFELGRELGRGGMGIVYAARQHSLGRAVALKILRADLELDRAAAERFRREATTLAALHHRGIAQVHAAGFDAGRRFLAMELIDGAPLDRVLGALRQRAVGSLTADSIHDALDALCGGEPPPGVREPGTRARSYAAAAARLVADVADALAFAHARSVVHRDVKPSNILLRRDGSPVLSDFGLAHRGDLPALTRAGAFAGTPFYTSPEQASGRDDVDHRADLFSLGATLYELLTLRVPFDAASSAEVLLAIRTREPLDPRRLVPRLPRDLVAIVQKALEKDPRRRYPDAAAFAADLRAFVDLRPVRAKPISPLGRATRWASRQPWQATLAATLLIAVPTVSGLVVKLRADRAKVLAAERLTADDRADAAILAGHVLLGDERVEPAAQEFERALRIRPGDAEAFVGLALVASERGSTAVRDWLAACDAAAPQLRTARAVQRARIDALRSLDEAAAADALAAELGPPRDPLEMFWTGMRSIEQATRNKDAAAARAAHDLLLDAALATPHARPAFHYWLAVAAGEIADVASARRAATAMQRLWPDSSLTWLGTGLALHQVDPAPAVAAYRRAIDLGYDTAQLHNNLANALSQLGDEDAAIAAWRRAIELEPGHAIARGNLGRALFYRGQLEDAVAELDACIAADPRSVVGHHYRVWALRRLERPEAAVAAARAAVAALPNVARTHRSLADALQDGGDTTAALAAAGDALALDPDDPASLGLLADLQLASGDASAAYRTLRDRVDRAVPERRDRAREDLVFWILSDAGASATAEMLADAATIAAELVAASDRANPFRLSLLAHARQRTGAPRDALAVCDEILALTEGATRTDVLELRAATIAQRGALQQQLEAGSR